jgi:periplasmic copper chaperone A
MTLSINLGTARARPAGLGRCVLTFTSVSFLLLSAGLVHAHASLETREATVSSSYKAVVKIGHGCEGAATTKISVTIPAGVVAVKPMPKAGWTISTTKAAYDKSYKHFSKQLTDGVTEVTWTGGNLPDDHYDEFVFASYLTDNWAAGAMVYFPIVQTCEKGEHRWVEIPAAGQDAHALKSPAPGLKIVTAKTTAASKTYAIGDLTIETPWTRATPGGAKVAGGYVRITNKGQVADRLSGGTLAAAGRVEVHEMSMTDGVMKMRMLPQGLEIKPGETVELKPGSFHLMFMDLSAGLVDGKPVKGSLDFEKAGKVDVEFAVAPLGAASMTPSHH